MVARRIRYASCCPAVARCVSAVREAVRRRGGSVQAHQRAARMVVDVRGGRASARERGDSGVGLVARVRKIGAQGSTRRDRERARRGRGRADQQTGDVPRDVGCSGLRDAVRQREKTDRRRGRDSELQIREGRIVERSYAPAPDQPRWQTYLEKALPWLRAHRADLLAHAYPSESLNRNAAAEWVSMLCDWRAAIGQPEAAVCAK